LKYLFCVYFILETFNFLNDHNFFKNLFYK
jgi:hypothetical protein